MVVGLGRDARKSSGCSRQWPASMACARVTPPTDRAAELWTRLREFPAGRESPLVIKASVRPRPRLFKALPKTPHPPPPPPRQPPGLSPLPVRGAVFPGGFPPLNPGGGPRGVESCLPAGDLPGGSGLVEGDGGYPVNAFVPKIILRCFPT